MNEMASAVSAASTTRSVMYVKTLKVRNFRSAEKYCASSYSMAALRCERVRHPLHLHESRTLHQDRRAGGSLGARCREKRARVLEMPPALAESLDGPAAVLAEREEEIDARLAGEAAHLRVHV